MTDHAQIRRRPAARRISSWPVWEAPARLLTALITVETTTVGLVVAAALVQGPVVPAVWWHGLVLLLLGLVHTEVAAGIERSRRRMVTGTAHVGLTSVWTFAGAILLPLPLAAALCVVLQLHDWYRTGRPRVPLYRTAFSTATLVLACMAAGVVVHGTGGVVPASLTQHDVLIVVLAAGVYATVNTALIAAAIVMTAVRPGLADAVGDWNDNLVELAALSLGGLVAVTVLVSPWLVVLVLPPLLVLQRAVLVRSLEEAASTDAKTGLLNAATWHVRAEEAVRRAGRGLLAVLVLDLDHFKTVNDTHGHLVGDQVLAAVARAVRAEVRERDLAGRFGGEEFVVLLAGPDGSSEEDLEAVAERIRRRVAAMQVVVPTADGPLTIAGLSVSVGGAFHLGADGVDLTALMRVADTALYSAKRAGRNRVRMGVARPMEPVSSALPVTGTSDAE